MVVRDLDPALKCGPEAIEETERASFEAASFQLGEHRSTRLIHDEYAGVKCSCKRGMREQPLVHHGCLVGGEVIEDHLDRQAGMGLAVDLGEEVPEVHGPVWRGSLVITLPVTVFNAANGSTVPCQT